MSREQTAHRDRFWQHKRREAERESRLEQCSYCLGLYEQGTEHHCGRETGDPDLRSKLGQLLRGGINVYRIHRS